MSSGDKTLLDQLLDRMKNHPVVTVLLFVVILLIGLSQFTSATGRLYQQIRALFTETTPHLVVEIPNQTLMLRWNELVNSWRHPQKDLRFETELRLPLSFRNDGGKAARIEALRLLSSRQGREITWEALWQARDFKLEPYALVEPQIQAHRDRLVPFSVKPGETTQQLLIDFVPLDFPRELPPGSYRNRLQAKPAGAQAWQDLLQFDFTVAEDFKLSDLHISRYQTWQSFPLKRLTTVNE